MGLVFEFLVCFTGYGYCWFIICYSDGCGCCLFCWLFYILGGFLIGLLDWVTSCGFSGLDFF